MAEKVVEMMICKVSYQFCRSLPYNDADAVLPLRWSQPAFVACVWVISAKFLQETLVCFLCQVAGLCQLTQILEHMSQVRLPCGNFWVFRPSAELWYNVPEAFPTAGPFRGGSRCTLLRRSPGPP